MFKVFLMVIIFLTPFLFSGIIKTVDISGNTSPGTSISLTADSLSPNNVTITSITRNNNQITINWADPSDEDYNHVEITWKPDLPQIIPSGVGSFTATYLQEETSYSFNIKSVDTTGNISTGRIVVTSTSAESETITKIFTLPVYNAEDLNAIRGGVSGCENRDLTKSYVLMNDIDLSTFNTGGGWIPVGDETTPFTGTFNGNGYTVSNLFINRPEVTTGKNQGLFGVINNAIIENLIISNVDITIFSGAGLVGKSDGSEINNCTASGNFKAVGNRSKISGLVGINNNSIIDNCSISGILTTDGKECLVGSLAIENSGSIKNSFSKIDITAENSNAGGLVGINNETIENCYSAGTIKGYKIGGLVFENCEGIVKNCYSTATISSTTGSFSISIGGLIGSLWGGTVENSYATGSVSATGITVTGSVNATGITVTDSEVGGLVGYIDVGKISKCYATGDIYVENTSAYVGGLSGRNDDGLIEKSYATGNITAKGEYIEIGGLSGLNFKTIKNSYAMGNVTIDGESGFAGGLVGHNCSEIENSYAVGIVTASESNVSGGLVGNNDGIVTGGFYDAVTTSQSDTEKGTPLLTADMKVETNYTGWNFVNEIDNGTDDPWVLDELINNGYPYLKDNSSLLFSGIGNETHSINSNVANVEYGSSTRNHR